MKSYAHFLFISLLSLTTTNNALAQVVYKQISNDFQVLQELVLEAKESTKNPDKIGYTIGQSSIRVTTFRLQGVLRLLKKSSEFSDKKSDKLADLNSEVKDLEDIIGKMAEATDLLKAAQKKLEKAIDEGKHEKEITKLQNKVGELKEKADKKSKDVYAVFEESGWFGNNAANEKIEEIDFLKDYSGQQEIDVVTDVMADEFQDTLSKIGDELLPSFREEDFGHQSMEDNFHEFRRLIRWMAIYIQSLPDIFSLTPYTHEGFTEEQIELLKDFKNDKYTEILSENSPILINRYEFYLLAQYIGAAGEAKDEAEEHFKLLEAGLDSELDEEQFKKDMIQMMESFVNSQLTEILLENLQ